MDYQQTLDFLYNQLPYFQRQGKAAFNKDLGKTIALCNAIENPQKHLKFIHVAGTNGKGSVSHFLASVYKEAGYNTGLYTSPHMVDFRERIRINGDYISQDFVCEFVNTYKSAIDQIGPSFFELTFAMALSYFYAQKTDIVILETGMGGRLDSTNIIDRPELAIITNIGLDHTDYLGNTIAEIAAEKAGIVKANSPILLTDENEVVVDVVQKAAKNHSTLFFQTKKIFRSEGLNPFKLYQNQQLLAEINAPIKAEYQKENMLTVAAAWSLLAENWKLELRHLVGGIENVQTNFKLLGRWQFMQQNPTVICDVGHNFDGIKAALHQLEFENYSALHLVFGMVNDKDTSVIEILPKKAHYHLCQANIPRALPYTELQNLFQEKQLNIQSAQPSVAIAVKNALSQAKSTDLVLVVGSLFVVAEVVSFFEN